jgi:hypothetical protein
MRRCNAAAGGVVADVPGVGTEVGNPAGFMVDAIEQGLSSNQAIAAFREAGGAMGNEAFRRLYGEVGASIADRSAAAALDPYALPGASDYTKWSMGAGGQYVTTVDVLFRDVGTNDVGRKQYMYKTADPHTPAEAQLAAWGDMGDPDNESQYGQRMVGAITRNVYLTVPWVG